MVTISSVKFSEVQWTWMNLCFIDQGRTRFEVRLHIYTCSPSKSDYITRSTRPSRFFAHTLKNTGRPEYKCIPSEGPMKTALLGHVLISYHLVVCCYFLTFWLYKAWCRKYGKMNPWMFTDRQWINTCSLYTLYVLAQRPFHSQAACVDLIIHMNHCDPYCSLNTWLYTDGHIKTTSTYKRFIGTLV